MSSDGSSEAPEHDRLDRLLAALDTALRPIFAQTEEQAVVIAQLQDQLARVTEERDDLRTALDGLLARVNVRGVAG